MVSANCSEYAIGTTGLGPSFWGTGVTSDHSGLWLSGSTVVTSSSESISISADGDESLRLFVFLYFTFDLIRNIYVFYLYYFQYT
ncbi:hypothetical protein HanPSC8_Chr07g0270891 [Helianthus annuus]|nr:hypothetical protein HanPSC8_Chr07g0270891 [Helianthus annuus]